MAEELQGLLDRIQKDGIDKAESEATKIIKDAKASASEIINKAKSEAEAMLAKAENDGKTFQQRGEIALSQAARDVILSVADAISATLQEIVSKSINSSFNTEDFNALIKQAVLSYCENENAANIELIIGESKQEEIAAYFMKEMSDKMQDGLTIKGDRNIISGFIVSMKEDGVHHDFTGETLADAIGSLLRPQLAEIVKKATKKTTPSA